MVQLKADPSLLELTPRQSPSQSENGAPGNNTKQLYLLAVVDTSGVVLRLATDDDLKSIPCPAAKRSKPAPKTAAPKPADPAKATLQELLEARKGDGPVCDHCGATGERSVHREAAPPRAAPAGAGLIKLRAALGLHARHLKCAPIAAMGGRAGLLLLLPAQRSPAVVLCRPCASAESPQWRRGPDSAPVVCNACGTRFRCAAACPPAPCIPPSLPTALPPTKPPLLYSVGCAPLLLRRRTGSMGAPIPCYMRKRPADSSATEDGPGAAKTPKPSEKRPNLVSA
jgi:hypothetical protein